MKLVRMLAVAAYTLLAGCGGGGGSSVSPVTPASTATPAATADASGVWALGTPSGGSVSLERFDANLTPVVTISGSNTGLGTVQFAGPIAVDGSGNVGVLFLYPQVYTPFSSHGDVEVFGRTASGNVQAISSVGSFPVTPVAGLALDTMGNGFIVDAGCTLYRVLLGNTAAPYTVQGEPVAAGSCANLVADQSVVTMHGTFNGRVYVVLQSQQGTTATGSVVRYTESSSGALSFEGGITLSSGTVARDVAVDASGTVLVTTATAIARYPASDFVAGQLSAATPSGTIPVPAGGSIAVDLAGNIAFASSAGLSEIRSGGQSVSATTPFNVISSTSAAPASATTSISF